MMNTTSFDTNKFAVPVFTQPQPQILCFPQVIPMPQVMHTLPPCQVLGNMVPQMTPLKYWDASTNSVSDFAPMHMQPTVVNNQFVVPHGYSFVLMDVPQTATVSDSGESVNVQETYQSQSRSVSVSPPEADPFLSRPPQPVSRQSTPEPVEPEKKRKYKHRSKQERIEQVHQEVKEKYTSIGLYAAEDEVLRGFDTIRVHVKTYRGLNVINQPLDKIMSCPHVDVLKIATPFSMKNKFQKKGFIVYLKLADPSQVPVVQSIFAEYAEFFPKCDIALKKEDKLRLDAEKAAEEARKEEEKFAKEPTFLSQAAFKELESWDDAWGVDSFGLAPPAMNKSESLTSVAA